MESTIIGVSTVEHDRQIAARWLALGAVIGPVLFTLAWLILGLVSPGFTMFGVVITPYSPVSAPISGLGLGVTAPFMNAAFVICGLMLLVGLFGISASLKEMGAAARWMCIVLLALMPLGSILDGLFTIESFFPHFVGFLLGCGTPALSFLVTGLSLRGIPQWRRLGNWLLLASPLTLTLLVLFLLTFTPTAAGASTGVAGLTERILIVEVQAWYVILGWIAFKRPYSNAYKGLPMEGIIARWYARNTRQGRDFDVLARRISQIVPVGGKVLEVAPGPGFLAVEIARRGKYRVSGVDISKTFVEIERANAQEAGVEIDFRQGDSADLPFQDASFDFVICTAAFKNFARPVRALGEMYRVLRPQGKALVLDLRHDASRAEINREIEGMGLNWINTQLTRWTFSQMLLRSAYTEQQIREFLAEARIPESRVETSGIGFEIWLEK